MKLKWTRLMLWLGVLALATPALTSCKAVDNATGVNNADVGASLEGQEGTMTRKELSQKLRRLATAYLGTVPQACDTIASTNIPIRQRVLALNIRVNSSDAVIAIAADPDPQVAMLNMVTVLSLQRMLAEERAEEFFGKHGRLYIDAAQRMEDEAWMLADQVLDEKEEQELREVISKYRQENPEEVYVWWVRFSAFSAYREQFSIADLGRGVVDLFVPVGDAVAGIESTGDIAERATWLAARQTQIAQWRLELAYLQFLAEPETERIFNDFRRATDTVNKLPEQIEKERIAILKAAEDQQEALGKLIADGQGVVDGINTAVKGVESTIEKSGETVDKVNEAIKLADKSIENAKKTLPETEKALVQLESTSESLNKTIQALDTFVRQFESEEDAEPGRPFDITEYTTAAQEIGTTVERLNTLVSNLDATADPERLNATLADTSSAVRALIWQAGLIFVGGGLVLIAAVKWMPARARPA